MARRGLAVAAVVAALFAAGCDGGEGNPCEILLPFGKTLWLMPEPDGTEVEVDGRPMVCIEGSPEPAP